MCGFVCILNDQQLNGDSFASITKLLEHRGPDDEGNWIDVKRSLFLGHRRLSVLDTSNLARQPMESFNKRYVIVFNGEIYNHLNVRDEITKKTNSSFLWKSSSDTETLLESISLFGIEETLKKIVGMFSFVIFDKKENKLIFSRDRFGEKPLYYGIYNNILFIASDLVTLNAYNGIEKNVDPSSLYYLLQYNYIPSHMSIFKNIKKLPASTYSEINIEKFKSQGNSAIKIKKYWSISNKTIFSTAKNDNDHEKNLDVLLNNSVRSQMISDVPIGAFLSGGIDSSLIVSILQRHSSRRVKTFTVGFQEKEFNEAAKAKKISKYLNTDHNEIYFNSNDVINLVPELHNIFSEPFADPSSLPTILISKIARQNVTVALSGDGGDEIFGGYNRYKFLQKIKNYQRFTPNLLENFFFKIIKTVPDYFWDHLGKRMNIDQGSDKIRKIKNILEADNELEGFKNILLNTQLHNKILKKHNQIDFIAQDIDRGFKKNIKQLMMEIDQKYYLSDNILVKLDRSAMASSLETRAPFLNADVVDYANNLPLHLKINNKFNKVILRNIIKKYLPQKIIDSKKSGFNAPIDIWLRGPLKEWAEDMIYSEKLKNSEYLNHNNIVKLWKEHLSGNKNFYRPLWSILVFQSWLQNAKM